MVKYYCQNLPIKRRKEMDFKKIGVLTSGGDAPGMNSAAITLLAFLQPFIFKLFVTYDRREQIIPSIDTMRRGPFIGYVTLCVIIHHLFYQLSILNSQFFILNSQDVSLRSSSCSCPEQVVFNKYCSTRCCFNITYFKWLCH